MTTNPNYRPDDFYIQAYQNTGKGSAPSPLILNSTRVQNVICTQAVSPQCGEAQFSIVVGNASQTAQTLSTNPATTNYLGNSVAEFNTFISSMRWAMVKIFTYASNPNTTNETVGDILTYRQELPSTPDSTSLTNPVCVFCGVIWQISVQTGLFSQTIDFNCIDLGGWMNLRPITTALKTSYSFTESTIFYTQVQNQNLPDFNERIAETITPNMSTLGQQTQEIDLLDYTINLKMTPFNGIDPNFTAGTNRRLWTAQDIVQFCFDFFNSWYADRLTGAGITLAFNDMTQNLASSIGTYSSRESIWVILNNIINRKSGLFMYWTYSGSDNLTATLNIGFFSDTTLLGWTGTPTIDYTNANSYPVGQYRGDVVVNYVDNDSCPYIRVSTLAPNLVGTFNLKEQFYEGYPTGVEQPTPAAVELGGINAKFWSRFVLKPDVLFPVYGNGVLSSATPQTWVDVSTCLSLRWTSDSATAAKVEVVPALDDDVSTPYDETLTISHTIPISNIDPAGTSDSKNTPGITFRVNGPSNLEIMDDCTSRYLANTLQFNPPNSSSDFGGIDRFENVADRTSIWMTLQVEGTSPLSVIVLKENVTHNDAGIMEVVIPYKPTLCLNNTVLAVDEGGNPTVSIPSTGGDAVLVSADGTTLQKIYNDQTRYGQFFAKEKIKLSFSIGFIDTRQILGKILSTIDVPTVWNPAGAGDATSGIGMERWNTMASGTLCTMTKFNLSQNMVTYQTDFFNFIPGKRGE